MLKGSEILLQCLRAEGVDLVFGYPGGAIMPLYDALEGSGVRHILTRHEQGAVFRSRRLCPGDRQGVAMATSGPGATNLEPEFVRQSLISQDETMTRASARA
jgi:acetolactate synthase I/II/III large subunit